jgi:hypothetical protein
MLYRPSLIKIGSGIQGLIGGDSQTHRQHGDLISLLLFFQNKESRLIEIQVKPDPTQAPNLSSMKTTGLIL